MRAGDRIISRHRVFSLLFLELNRLLLTVLLMFALFFSVVFVGHVGPEPLRSVIAEADSLWWVFSPLLTAIVTAVALVVSFNQLVLSQELGALGDQQNRMDAAMDFRKSIRPLIEPTVGPAEPAVFLTTILEAIDVQCEKMVQESTAVEEQDTDLFERMQTEATTTIDQLEDASFGEFSVIRASLHFEYARWLFELEAHTESTSGASGDDIAHTLKELLEHFGPAREHFKTLYFQWELVVLSRRMMAAALPALVVTVGVLLTVNADSVQVAIFGVDGMVLLIAGAFTIALSPFLLLFSYVLRIATVAKQTLSIGPFLLHEGTQGSRK